MRETGSILRIDDDPVAAGDLMLMTSKPQPVPTNSGVPRGIEFGRGGSAAMRDQELVEGVDRIEAVA